MTVTRVILLTGREETPILAGMLQRANPALAVTPAHDLESLARLLEPGVRLLSFCSSVIVPGDLLQRLGRPGYNFHPGPPERPGRYPSVFALYEGTTHFGITVHEMTAAVDAGPIVATERFEIPKGSDLKSLEELTVTRLAQAFNRLAPYLATAARPLPHLPIAWHGRKTTKADCEKLCTITPDMDAAEIARRQRCCGTLASI
ncbi:MAG: formyltransferase family protein [Rhodospirillaceae bacterium]